MARFLKNRTAALGRAPGSLVFVGEQKVKEATIRVIDYDGETLDDQKIQDIKDAGRYNETNTVSWININGLHDAKIIGQIGRDFGLHPLVTEDILNTGQRPKMEEYDDYIFFCAKMMRYNEESGKIESEQLSMILGKTFVLTFQERPGDVFEPVRDRIRKRKGRIRRVGVDYLAYALLDTIVDNYIFIIERLGEQTEDIEDEILGNPNQDVLSRINSYKREMNYLRKTIRPVREFMLQFARIDSNLIHPETVPFLKDLLDLTNQAVDVIDSYRDMLSDHLSIYNTGVSNRLNEIMKVLTIFSAIFIPLTFIAGIYGTNFDHVPELHFRYSYFAMWGVMGLVSLGMFRFFRKKKWV